MKKHFTQEWQESFAENQKSKENKGKKGLGYGSLSNSFQKSTSGNLIGGENDVVTSESVILQKSTKISQEDFNLMLYKYFEESGNKNISETLKKRIKIKYKRYFFS